jgi:hypothetical protein
MMSRAMIASLANVERDHSTLAAIRCQARVGMKSILATANGDGKSDILWRADCCSDGWPVWLMDGMQVLSEFPLHGAGDNLQLR